MSGIIRWLAPHMFPQLNQPGATPTAATPPPATPNPVDPSANAAAQWMTGGAPGSLTAPATAQGLATPPSSFQNALQNAWQRYAGQGQPLRPPAQPQVTMTPTPGQTGPSAHWVGGLRPLPPLSAPPAPQQHDMHPASIRVDFHPPPEPPDPLSLAHPGMGGTGQALAAPPPNPWLFPGPGPNG